MVVLVGSLLHSLMFVISDWVLCAFNCHGEPSGVHGTTSSTKLGEKKQAMKSSTTFTTTSSSISGEIWSCCLGMIEATFMLLWVVIGILMTGFHEEGWAPPSPSSPTTIDGNINYVLGGFILLVLVDAIHAAAFFTLLKNIGAVASALLKGLQMVVVIALSAFFFCAKESSQCLTYNKSVSAFLVMCGVFSYGLGKSTSSSTPNPTPNIGQKKEKMDCISTLVEMKTKVSSTRSQDSVEMKKLIE